MIFWRRSFRILDTLTLLLSWISDSIVTGKISEFFEGNQIPRKETIKYDVSRQLTHGIKTRPWNSLLLIDAEKTDTLPSCIPIVFPSTQNLPPPSSPLFHLFNLVDATFLLSIFPPPLPPSPFQPLSQGGKRTVLLAASTKDLFPADATRADNITVGNREGGGGGGSERNVPDSICLALRRAYGPDVGLPEDRTYCLPPRTSSTSI